MNKSEQINELAGALCKAQRLIKGALKDSNNPHFKSQYADLSSVWNEVREPLTENGLCISQCVVEDALHTILMHTSGQWLESIYPLRPATRSSMPTPQDFMAALTYARRGALAAITGCPSVADDDGNHASGLPPVPIIPTIDPRERIYTNIRFVRGASGYEIINNAAFGEAVQEFIRTSKDPNDHKLIGEFLAKCPHVHIVPATGGRMS